MTVQKRTDDDAEDVNCNGHLPELQTSTTAEAERVIDILESTVPSAIEEALCNLGLGLSSTPASSEDQSLCVLQHLSGHPWLQFSLQREEYFSYQIEWEYVLPGISKLQFLQTLWASSSKLEVIYDHFRVPFICFVVEYDGSALKVTAKGQGFGNISDTSFVPSPFLEHYEKNKEVGIFLFNTGHHFRLISTLDTLYPCKFTYAEKLIDFINQFQMLSKEVEARAMIQSVDSILSSTETVDRVNSVVKEISAGLSLGIIWSRIFSKLEALRQHFLIQKLMALEQSHELTFDELMRLRISLIHSFTIELFRPLRKIVLEEKERQERIAEDMADSVSFLDKTGELLKEQIDSTEKEIVNLETELKSAKDEFKKSESALKKSSKKDAKKLRHLQKQLEDFKGQEAINALIQKLFSPPLERFKMITEVLKDMKPFSNHPPRDLVTSLCELYKLDFTPELQHGSSSFDPTILEKILDTFESVPVVDIDDEDNICVSGRNVILSSIKDELIRIVKNRKHSQVKVQCQEVLTLDTGLEKVDFHGMNVVIIASKILVADHEVNIDVSGNDGERHFHANAEDGANEGDPGENGKNGNPGQNGGSVHIEALSAILNHENLKVHCGGGKGADGQIGGNGRKGRDGDDGANARTTAPDWTVFGNEFYKIERGKEGKGGHTGGAGGHGGFKGQGGLGGTFRIVENGKLKFEKKFEQGKDAEHDAKHGRPGVNGYDGIQGKDHGFACESRAYSWKEATGYNLRTRNTLNLFGCHIGYILEKGDTPSRTQQVMSQNKVNTRKKTSEVALRANTISTKTIQAMKNTILTSTNSNQLDSGVDLQEEIDGVSDQMSSIATCNSAKKGSLAKQQQAIKTLQQRHVAMENNLSSSQTKASDIKNSIIQNRKDQEEAELRAKELEHVAINLKEAQEGALQMSSLLQMQAETQVQSQAMQITEISQGPQVLATKALRNVSQQAAESASKLQSHFDPNYAAFLKLVQKVTDFEVQSAIETGFQELASKGMVLTDKEILTLLQSLVKPLKKDSGENLSFLNYFNNFFFKDLAVSRNFPDRNWFAVFINLRRSLLAFHDLSSIPKKKALNDHLDLIRVELVYGELLQDWLLMEVPKRTILSQILKEQLPHAKNSLIHEAVKIYEFLKSHSDLRATGFKAMVKDTTKLVKSTVTNSVDIMENPQSFLKKMIEVMSMTEGTLEEPPLRPFAKILEPFKYEYIRDMMNQLTKEADVESFEKIFKYIQFLLQYTDLDALHLGKFWRYVQELGKTRMDKKSNVAELEVFVQKTYDSMKSQILMKIQNQDPYLLLKANKVIESKNRLDSENIDTIFQSRLEFYKKLQNSSNPSEQLFEIYNRKKPDYIQESAKTFAFNSFLEFIKKAVHDRKDENTKQILYHLEVGKFSKGKLVDFSMDELLIIENLLWAELTEANSKEVTDIGKLIATSSVLSKIEATELKSNCDIAVLAEECEKILEDLLQCIPVSNAESGNTQELRHRKYFRFIILEIQLALIFGMQCEKIEKLKDDLSQVDKAEVDKIIEKLEEFLESVGFKVLPSEPADLTICNEENPFVSFRQALHFIKWDMKIPDERSQADLVDLVKTLNGLDIDPENEAHQTWAEGAEAAIKLLRFLMSPTTSSYPLQTLRQVLSVKEKELRTRHRQLCNYEASLNGRLLKIKAHPEVLFITAAFCREVLTRLQQNVLDEDLEMQVISELSRSRKLEPNNAPKLTVKVEILKMEMETYHFMKEFEILSGVFFAGKKIIEASFNGFQILQAQLNELSKSLEDQWTSLVTKYQENISSSKMLRHKLAIIITSLKFGDPLIPFLLRVVQNLGEKKEISKNSIPPLGTTEAAYSFLIQKDKDRIGTTSVRDYFLQGEEVEIFNEILKLVKDNPEDDFRFKLRNALCTLNPLAWQGWLERALFNKMYKCLTSECSSSLRGMKYFANQAKLAERETNSAGDEKKKQSNQNLLRVFINAQLYPYFKMTYILQPPETRLKWLTMIGRLTERVSKAKFGLFKKPSCVKIFLILLRDVGVEDLEIILRKSFPQNWIKEILISAILKDFDFDEQKKLIPVVEGYLRTLLSTVNHPTLEFLILFHNVIRKELSLLSAKENDPCSLGQKILEKMAISNFTPLQIHEISTEIQHPHLKPFAHWPRVLRILTLRFTFPAPPDDESLVESLLSLDENYNEETVDLLAKKLSNWNAGNFDLSKILEKFLSLEWILDAESIALIQAGKSQESISRDIANYSKQKRANEATLDELHNTAGTLHLNKGNANALKEAKILVESVYRDLKTHYDISNGIRVDDLKTNVLNWVAKWKETFENSWNPKRITDNQISQTVALLYRAMQWQFANMDKKKELGRKPRDSQLLSIMMLILGLRSGKGRLGQIQTGEGKSCIVATFAAFCSLLKAHVHIITSNTVLAQADAGEFQEFFETLLDLKVCNNCDKEAVGNEERGKRYNKNVVYGELTYFQGDFLNTFFHGKEIYKTPDVIIVDEVDSLVLDKGSNMLYLSHSIPELKHLRFVFLLIWEAVNARAIPAERKAQSRPYTEADVHVVRRTVEKKLKSSDPNAEVQVPKCLKGFVTRRVGIWVKQAFMARFMEANDQFKVDEGKQSIVNMDNDTGVEQANMHLSLGLHQFLQLKYKAKLTPESLKCVFISNLDYFSKLNTGQLFGITGTIGGPDETKLLNQQYDVDFFEMPRYQQSNRVQQPSVLAQDEAAWKDAIFACVESRVTNQPILIITENLAALEKVTEILQPMKTSLIHKLFEYKSSERDADFTKKVKDDYKGLNKGHVVVSTNLGGRGTDFAIHDEAKEAGLHVILSFLPPNLRVEKQAFGRTARAGQNGTSGFIIQVDPAKSSSRSLYQLKEERRESEAKRIQMMREKDIPRIKMEDDLFKLYTKYYKHEIQTCSSFRRHNRRIRKLQLEFLNNRWAMWLDSIKFRVDSLPLQGSVGRTAILREFEKFKATQTSKLESNNEKVFAELTSELTKLAIQYEKLGTKSLFGTLIDADYEECGEIWEDAVEPVTEAFNNTLALIENVGQKVIEAVNSKAVLSKTLEVLKSLPDNAVNGVTRFSDKKMARPPLEKKSSLQIGVEILKLARKEEHPVFTEPPTAYSSALVLQVNPGKRREAKDFLKAAVNQINSKVELNHSAIDWLQNTSLRIEQNGEAVSRLVRRNRFQEQITSETNLLNIHLSSIHSILVSPITPKVLQNQIAQVDTEAEAVELLDHLSNPDWNLLKSYRFSRRAEEMNLKDQLATCSIFCSLSDLMAIIKKTQRSVIQPEDFEEIIITKWDFLEQLKTNQLLEDVEVDLINLDEVIFKETEIEARKVLGQAFETIAVQLSGRKNYVLTQELKLFRDKLLKLDWIRTKNLPLKVTKGFRKKKKCLDSNISCSCEAGFHDLYEVYSDLAATTATRNIFQDERIVGDSIIDYNILPFPETDQEGALELFKNLVSKRVIKEPRVEFPALGGSGRKDRIKAIETTLNSTDFGECLTKWMKANEASEKEQELKKFVEVLKEVLLGSIGSLKRYDEIRVNYESVSSMVPLDLEKEYSDELNEMLAEGVFDRVIVFDEYIRWYNNKALLVAALGIAEIALGVAVEFSSGGLLGPLTTFLISEGSSDFVYAMRHIYRGNQVTWKGYKEDKIDSLIWSAGQALTLGFIPGAGIASDLMGAIGKTILKEVLKGGAKALIFNFIENNVKKGFKTNFLGINVILDTVMGTPQIHTELQNFYDRSSELWAAAWKKDLAIDTIEKLVELSISAEGKNSIFNQELEAMHSKIKWSMRFGLIYGLAKNVLPIGDKSLAGTFGSSESVLGRSLGPTQELILLTLQGLNLRLKEKTDKFKGQSEEMNSLLQVAKIATTDEEERAFQEFMEKQTTIVKQSMRKRIVNQFIKEITGQTVRAELHESIRKGYARTLVAHNLKNVREFIEEEDRKVYNEEAEPEDGQGRIKCNDWEHSTTVSNAWGRTVFEVREEWKGTLERMSAEDLEFLTDNRGNCYVCPIFQESLLHKFVLDLHPQAFDELLEWTLLIKDKGMLKEQVDYSKPKEEMQNNEVKKPLPTALA